MMPFADGIVTPLNTIHFFTSEQIIYAFGGAMMIITYFYDRARPRPEEIYRQAMLEYERNQTKK